MISLISRKKSIILYGLLMAVFLFLLRWMELRFIVFDHAFEIYVGAIALLFTGLGIWLALKISRPQTVIIEKEIHIAESKVFELNLLALERLNLSKRELEVLQLMAEGLSNGEISERLFVSVNTIKTHSSKLFEKMEVKRRTQAIEKGKRLGIIA